MSVFERADELQTSAHEQIMFCRDERTGLRAIIGIHDTTLGPALGGTRFYPYASEADALTDCLRLSEGMTYKAAAAGVPLGGGKAVIIGDPAKIKTPELLRMYGRFVERLGGTYVTAADVGTTSDDLDIVGETTRHVVGRTKDAGGSGDSGFSTAYGVFCAMAAAAQFRWGSDRLLGRTVGVEGAGKVGFHLVGLLLDAGAAVVVADPSELAVTRVLYAYKGVATATRVIDSPIDVYAPCALGATLTAESVADLKASVVCGAANNQLITQDVAANLADRDILWVPDYVANGGGLIQVGGELLGKSDDEVLEHIRHTESTVEEVLRTAIQEKVTTGAAARDLVRRRLLRSRADADS